MKTIETNASFALPKREHFWCQMSQAYSITRTVLSEAVFSTS